MMEYFNKTPKTTPKPAHLSYMEKVSKRVNDYRDEYPEYSVWCNHSDFLFECDGLQFAVNFEDGLDRPLEWVERYHMQVFDKVLRDHRIKALKEKNENDPGSIRINLYDASQERVRIKLT